MYLFKELIENKLSQIIDQLNERENKPIKFYSTLLNKILSLMEMVDTAC